MVRYLLRRAVLGILTLFLFGTMVFFLIQIIMPGDYTSSFILTQEEREAVRNQLGLDRPLWLQYAHWAADAARGDLGGAFSGGRVTDRLWAAIPYSLFAFVLAVGAAFLVGGWLGRATAWRRGRWLRGATTAASIGLYTSFPPWVAFASTFVLTSLLGPLALRDLQRVEEVPPGPEVSLPSLVGPRLLWLLLAAVAVALVTLPLVARAWRAVFHRRAPIIALMAWVAVVQVGASAVTGVRLRAFDLAAAQAIPLVLLFLLFVGEVVVLTQAAMAGANREDFVLAARGKGLPEHEVRDRHAARASVLPILSRFAVSLPYFLAGMVIVEGALESPGLGTMLFTALDVEDTPLAVGSLLVIGLIAVAARLVLDVLLAAMDPRIRFAGPARGRS